MSSERPIKLVLEMESTNPIRGMIRASFSEPVAFQGWLEFAAGVERVRAGAGSRESVATVIGDPT